MTFHSILDPPGGTEPVGHTAQPDHFVDLGLDHVVAAITAGREDYDLQSLFWSPLGRVSHVRYRQEVFADLADERVLGAVRSFSAAVVTMRRQLDQARSQPEHHHSRAWFLCAAESYCGAVRALTDALASAPIVSAGLVGLRGFLGEHVAGPTFTALDAERTAARAALRSVRYCVHVQGLRVRVSSHAGEEDYGETMIALFERFAGAPAEDHRVAATDRSFMDRVEAAVLERLARLFPDAFGALDAFCDRWATFPDPTLIAFERDVQFYLGVLDYLLPIRTGGLPVCLPDVSDVATETTAVDAYDIALAHHLVATGAMVVTNDVHFGPGEQLLVVTGPNHGGKTTFARTVGQLHDLAALGCPVPARAASLGLVDRVFTHFVHQENLAEQRGGLADDLARVHAILRSATSRSVVVVNELFSSTTAADAALLGSAVIDRLLRSGAIGVYVTFLDELASLGGPVVSLVAEVDRHDVAARTFRVERRQADGRAYAIALAAHHGLTADRLRQRLTS